MDPGESGGTHKLVGGRVSLDFVNTVSWPGDDREYDWLEVPENWLRWCLLVGLVDPAMADRLRGELASPSRTTGLVSDLQHARDQIAAVLAPLAKGAPPAPEEVARLNPLVTQAVRHRRIDVETLQWEWEEPTGLADLLWPVVFDAAELLTSESPESSRIGRCPECSWLFHDATKNRGRRWCDMADCGSRNKARAYYRRARQKDSSLSR